MQGLEPLKDWGRRNSPGLWNFGIYAYWQTRLATPWTETTVFKQMRRVRQGRGLAAAGKNGTSKKVLFFATRQERDQVAMVSMLSWALERRGHHPVVLGCDRALPNSCNSGMYPALSPWVCRACHRYAEHTLSLAGMPVDWLSRLLPPGAREAARAAVDRIEPTEYRHFSYRGFPVGDMVRHSVAHFLRTDKILDDPASTRVYRNWLESAVWLVDACEALLDRHQPEVVLVLNGLFAPEWIMMEVARRRGVRLICWEVGFLPQAFLFQPSRPTDVVNNDHWERFRDVPLTAEENRRLDHYLAVREGGGGYLVNYFPELNDSTEEICREFGIDRSKQTFVLFPNITWDSACFEKDVGFNGLADWVTETIRFFNERPNAQLVVRVHPAEKVLKGAGRDSVLALIRNRFPQPPRNLIVVPPDSGASSYVLMKLAACGLVYGSTTGVEMGARGIPVIVAGQVYYRGLGFTYDPATRQEYRRMLDDVMSGRTPRQEPRRMEAWRRYAYFAIFRSAVPLPQVRYETAGAPVLLGFETLADLDPGRDPNLDAVCDGITEGTPFLTARVQWGD